MFDGEILLALVTENPRFYYEVVRELNGANIEFLSLKPGDAIPASVKVVMTTTSEKPAISFPKIVARNDLRYALAEYVKMSKGIEEVERLIIGVDPGLKPGIAVFADDILVGTEQLGAPEDVLEAVRKFLVVYGAKESVVRVGTGGGIYNMRILRTLQENLGSKAKIEVVDETSTTPDPGEIPSPELRDVVAAVNIALKNGQYLNKRIALNPKPGEIKQLQAESRKLNASVTISKELAEKVALGMLTLEDAVEEQAGKNGSHRDRKTDFNR